MLVFTPTEKGGPRARQVTLSLQQMVTIAGYDPTKPRVPEHSPNRYIYIYNVTSVPKSQV